MVREVGMLAALLLACGCSTSSVFACTQDVECSVGGQAGFCDDPGYCSFDDAACPSGRRFGSLAGMGLADECVQGALASTGVSDPTDPSGPTAGVTSMAESTSTMPSQTSSSSSTGGGSDESSTGSTTTGSSTGSSTESSSSSTSGGPDPLCTVYEFEGALPFAPLNPPFPIQVEVADGALRADWLSKQLGGAALLVDESANVAMGSLEVEISEFPAETGTVLSANWEDPSGNILSAFVDGDEFVVSHYDGALKTTTFPAGEPHGGRTRLRIRSADGLVVVEAGGDDSLDLITTIDPGSSSTPFDLTAVEEVSLFFNRYQAGAAATSIALASVTSCVSL